MKHFLPKTLLALCLSTPNALAAEAKRRLAGKPNGVGGGKPDGVGGGGKPDGVGGGKPATPGERSKNFQKKSRVPSFVAEKLEEMEIEKDAQGNRFKRKNLKMKTRGDIISLAEDKDAISSVDCAFDVDGPRITINFTEEMDADQLEEMFPTDALLTVHASVFGACDLGFMQLSPEEILDNPETPQLIMDSKNGYLEIERVEGDGHTVVVYGEKGSFYSEFEELEYDLERIEDGSAELDPNVRKLQDGCGPGSLVDGTFERGFPSYSIKLIPTFPFFTIVRTPPFVNVKANVCFNKNDSGIDKVSVCVGLKCGLKVSVHVILDIQTEASLRLKFSEFNGEANTVMHIFDPIPIASLPKVLSDIDRYGQLGHDEFGIYAALPLVIKGQHFLSNEITFTAYAGYDSGRVLNVYSLGTGGTSSKGYTLRQGRGPYYGTDLTGADDAQLDSTLFIGIRPTIALYSQTIYAGLGFDIGLRGDLQWIGKNIGSPFPALSDSVCGPICAANCKDDHRFEAGLEFVVEDMAARLHFDIRIRICVWKWCTTIFDKEYENKWTILAKLFSVDMGTLCAA